MLDFFKSKHYTFLFENVLFTKRYMINLAIWYLAYMKPEAKAK